MCVYIFSFLCCDVRYDFRIKTMLGSYLPPVVCRRGWAQVLLTLFVFVCVQWCTTHIVLCLCFVLFVLLPVSLDCPFFISPSVFSNVYFQHYFSYIARSDLLMMYLIEKSRIYHHSLMNWNMQIVQSTCRHKKQSKTQTLQLEKLLYDTHAFKQFS